MSKRDKKKTEHKAHINKYANVVRKGKNNEDKKQGSKKD
jgi:hypothetical protein